MAFFSSFRRALVLAGLPTAAAVAQTTTPGVGIGLTTPTQALDVNGGLLIRSYRAITTQGAYLQWNKSNGDGATWLLNQRGGGPGGLIIGAVTTGDAVTEWARFDGGGRLGIGTSSPATLLHLLATGTAANGLLVQGGSQPLSLSLRNQKSTADLGLANSTGDYDSGAAAGDVVLRTGANQNLILTAPGTGSVRLPDLAGTGVRLVTADAAGNLGSQAPPSGASFIQNSTSPQANANFNIDGSAMVGGSVQAGNNVVVDAAGGNAGTTAPMLRFGGSASGEGLASKRTSGGNQYGLDFYTASANRLSVTVGGRVGIGTSAPSQQLHVLASGTGPDGLLAEGGGQPMSLSVKNAQGTADLGVANSANEYATGAAPGDAVLRSTGTHNLILTTAGPGSVRVPDLGDGSSTRFVTADASGNLGTGTPAGDNLGNHTATQTLNLQGNALVGTGASISGVGVGVRADGGLNLGQNTAGNSIYLGYQAGPANTSGSNLFVGYQAGYRSTGGGNNLFVGYQSGYSNAGGMSNLFIGVTSGTFNTSGSYNQFLGAAAGFSNTTGYDNVFVGHQSGNNNTAGTDNTFLGYQAGLYSSTGTYNASLGANSGPANGSGAITNATAIGANVSLMQSNTVVLGNNANVGIGTSAPGAKLEVSGAIRATAFNTTSDQRLKTDVRPLGNALASVLALRGVRYRWNALGVQRGGQARAEQVGLLAQELEKVYPELVSTGPDGYKAVNYAQLAPVLIEALKEQQAQIETLKQQAAAATQRAARAEASLGSFEQRLRALEAGQGLPAQAHN